MSRQYLKELQERAQKLLQASSGDQDDEEEINARTITHRSAQKQYVLDLQEYHDSSISDASEVNWDSEHRTNDIELIKKCVTLVNQNKFYQQKLQEKDCEITQLKYQLKSKKETESELKYQLETITQKTQEKEHFVYHVSQNDYDQISKEKEELRLEKALLNKRYEDLEKEKNKFQKEKRLVDEKIREEFLKNQKRQLRRQQDQTIKQIKKNDGEYWKSRFEESQARTKIVEAALKDQSLKTKKLCQFINKELPMLKDMMVELTAKMDLKVQKYLLRDVNY